jgi:hypothetical protein
MDNADLTTYNNYVEILNQVAQMFNRLDKYRKEKSPDRKKVLLYSVRSKENHIRNLMENEKQRQRINNQKIKP